MDIYKERAQTEQECLTVNALTNEELIIAHRLPDVGQNDPKIIKHLICFCQKLKYVDENGFLGISGIPKEIDKAIQTCMMYGSEKYHRRDSS